jgi:hypothetical protein
MLKHGDINVFNLLQPISSHKSLNPGAGRLTTSLTWQGGAHMQDAQSTLRTDDTLSQPDIILPSQYFGALGSVGLSGELRLMLAVLIDAINVLESWKGGGSAQKRRNFAEAAQWVNTPGTSYPFSFDSVCDALEIESELMRSRLRVLTVRSANSARRPALARLRLKELSRGQHLTANRLRRREHVPRIVTLIGPPSELPSRGDRHAEQAQDCIAETSAGFAAFGQESADEAARQSVIW